MQIESPPVGLRPDLLLDSTEYRDRELSPPVFYQTTVEVEKS